MANVAVAGFQPARRRGGGHISYRRMIVATNNTNAIGLYDAVVQDSNFNILQASTTTTAVSSVSGGASYLDATGARKGDKQLPAATLYTSTTNNPDNASYVFVVDDSLLVDYLCSIGSANNLALTDFGINYAFIVGTITNGISGMSLNSTGRNVTATLPFRVGEYVISSQNDVDNTNNINVFARINAGMWEPALSASLGT